MKAGKQALLRQVNKIKNGKPFERLPVRVDDSALSESISYSYLYLVRITT